MSAVLEPTRDPISLGEPLVVHLVLQTDSPEPQMLDLGASGWEYLTFTVTSPSNQSTRFKLPKYDFSSGGKVTISKQSPYDARLNLSLVYKPADVGKYTVELQGTLLSKVKDVPVAAKTEVSVIAKNPALLKKEVQRLANIIMTNSDAKSIIEATSELGTIDDPVVVKPIESIFTKDPGAEPSLLDSLVRVGSAEAGRALLRIRNRAKGDERVFAEQALGLFREQTKAK